MIDGMIQHTDWSVSHEIAICIQTLVYARGVVQIEMSVKFCNALVVHGHICNIRTVLAFPLLHARMFLVNMTCEA